jgi:uncharacterized repeat protein (TIGR03803 family)
MTMKNGCPGYTTMTLPLQNARACLILLLCMVSAISSSQTYTILHTFGAGSDGKFPTGTLLVSGQTLYGVTSAGGKLNHGTLFKVNTDGSGYQVLHDFAGGNDGAAPVYGPVLSGATIYGITDGIDQSQGTGTVFSINIDGTGYSVLTNFNGDEGVSLTLFETNLYGTTSVRGNLRGGAIFKMNLNGTGFTLVRNFSASEGAPTAVVVSGAVLYGDTVGDGTWNTAGTVFKINTDGTDYALLHYLVAPTEGIWPSTGVLLGSGSLYGMTHSGCSGNYGGGTLFAIDPSGTNYRVVYNVDANGEGGWPYGRLLLSGKTLFATSAGGNSVGAFGSVFMVGIDGSGFTLLKAFTEADGAYPSGGVSLSGTTLYGTASGGGAYSNGVVFSLSPPLPSVQTPPTTQTAEEGSTVTLRTVAGGWPLRTYQWYFNGTNLIAGATNSFLKLNALQASQTGAYSVVIANASGGMTSAPALLNVIAPVARRYVPAITLTSQSNTLLNVQYSDSVFPFANWTPLTSVSITNTSQVFADVSAPLAAPRFYRAWQQVSAGAPPRLDINLVTAVILTGTVGSTLKLDYINEVGPIDAWTNLATLTLATSPQLFLDWSAMSKPARLYRLTTIP